MFINDAVILLRRDGERPAKFISTRTVMLRDGELVRGDAVVRSQTAFFTTLEQSIGENQCVGSVARLYAVDYTRSQDSYNTVDGRRLSVIPRLPPVKTEGGAIITDGIAFVLPEGVAVDGLAIVRSPSCVSEQEPTTEVILNYASASAAAATVMSKSEKDRRSRRRSADEELVRKADRCINCSFSHWRRTYPRIGPAGLRLFLEASLLGQLINGLIKLARATHGDCVGSVIPNQRRKWRQIR